MTREVCKSCYRENPVGFHVPDDIWVRINGKDSGVLCIMCFAEKADALRIKWDAVIAFFPVSRATFEEPLVKIPVRLAEISKHEVRDETIYKYQFVQTNPSSLQPWIHTAFEVRSLEPLDFQLEGEYNIDVS